MKRFSWLLAVLLWLLPAVCLADVRADFEEAYKLRMAAGACLAAYSDREGQLAYYYLTEEGWEIKQFRQTSEAADARFLLARKPADNSMPEAYLLAIVGTETIKDVKADLRTGKVYFAGSTAEEFAANAAKRDVGPGEPKVHQGFNDYVQTALTATTSDAAGGSQRRLAELLLADKNRKVFLVGHSLGGAAATIAGARLISMGVAPEQIEIITFGAPAVGNKAFADIFEPQLNLTRVVIRGDIVTGVLQGLVGGYYQFGREILWQQPRQVDLHPHDPLGYVDVALKNYYQVRQKALQAGAISLPPPLSPAEGRAHIQVAPAVSRLPAELAGEFWYMEQALTDEYRYGLRGAVLGTGNAGAAVDCRYTLVSEVSGKRLKNERNGYYINLQQTVLDAKSGAAVYVADFSTGTTSFTPLEAFIHATRSLRSDLAAWLAKQ
jgi:hypothetical protein